MKKTAGKTTRARDRAHTKQPPHQIRAPRAASAAVALLPALCTLFQHSSLFLELHPRAKQHAHEPDRHLYGCRRSGNMVRDGSIGTCRVAVP
jgi:hypothetical protein